MINYREKEFMKDISITYDEICESQVIEHDQVFVFMEDHEMKIESLKAKNGELEKWVKHHQKSVELGRKRECELEKKLVEALANLKESERSSNAYVRLTEPENTLLKEKLKVAVEALEFYGNIENWRNPKYPKKADFNVLDSEDGRDVDAIKGGHMIAGKRARQALSKIKSEGV